jgi:hypothetical protein
MKQNTNTKAKSQYPSTKQHNNTKRIQITLIIHVLLFYCFIHVILIRIGIKYLKIVNSNIPSQNLKTNNMY